MTVPWPRPTQYLSHWVCVGKLYEKPEDLWFGFIGFSSWRIIPVSKYLGSPPFGRGPTTPVRARNRSPWSMVICIFGTRNDTGVRKKTKQNAIPRWIDQWDIGIVTYTYMRLDPKKNPANVGKDTIDWGSMCIWYSYLYIHWYIWSHKRSSKCTFTIKIPPSNVHSSHKKHPTNTCDGKDTIVPLIRVLAISRPYLSNEKNCPWLLVGYMSGMKYYAVMWGIMS